MADFCQQCSDDLGFNVSDLNGITEEESWDEGRAAIVLCEGCGPIQVDPCGYCLSNDCFQNHVCVFCKRDEPCALHDEVGKDPIPLRNFEIVVAAEKDNGIGKDGGLPWGILSKDLRRFSRITKSKENPDSTKKNAVIMGRNTWESLPEKVRPLPGRLNIILSRKSTPIEFDPEKGLRRKYPTLEGALRDLNHGRLGDSINKVFVIGGSEVFEDALKLPELKAIHLTRIHEYYDCDTYFPIKSHKEFELKECIPMYDDRKEVSYEFLTWLRKEM